MKEYKEIDIEKFERADYFQYFTSVGNVIEFTVKIDVTKAIQKCKDEDISFQSYLLFQIYNTINTFENFKYDFLDSSLVQWKEIVPTFSAFNQNSKKFFTLYADMKEDYITFDKQYKSIVREYEESDTIVPQGNLPPNIFNVSSIPWMHFEHFSSNSKAQENQIIKMLTLGKFEKLDEIFKMPITFQVSHAIADGYHVSMFFSELQKKLNLY